MATSSPTRTYGRSAQLAAGAGVAAFLRIARLRSSALGESSSSLALARNASRPPRWSTDFSALADTRRCTERPSASDIMVTFTRLGRNRRLVLRFEWLTLFPTCTPLPVSLHRRDMANTFQSGPIASGAGPKGTSVRLKSGADV